MSLQRSHDRHLLILAGVLACLLGAGCGGDGSSSPTAPANPNNTNLSGTWVGTFSRPTGLGAVEVRWTITQNDNNLSGPGSLTYNGMTIDGLMAASWGSSSGPPLISHFRFDRTNAAVLPACQVVFPDGSPEFKDITPTSRTLTSNTLLISYNGCQGFIAPDPPGSSRRETTQLTLNKQ